MQLCEPFPLVVACGPLPPRAILDCRLALFYKPVSLSNELLDGENGEKTLLCNGRLIFL